MAELNEIERGDLCQTAIQSLYQVAGGLRTFPGLLKKVIAERAWERRVIHGQVIELKNLRQLITEKPRRGWGEDPCKIEAVIRDDPEALAVYREAMKQQGGDRRSKGLQSNGNNVTDRSGGMQKGHSRAYSIARVQRECDAETVAAVMSGEMSANAALVKSGIRENRQVYLPRDPAAAVEKLRRQFGDEFVEQMWRASNGR